MAAGICKAKQRRHSAHKAKRTRQNNRTFHRVTERRKRHAKNHEMSLDELEQKLGIKRWTSPPKSKSA